MRQTHFEAQRAEDWKVYEAELEKYEERQPEPSELDTEVLIRLYRDIARDLTVARSRSYSNDLVTRLNQLTLRGHNIVYKNKTGWTSKVLQYVVSGFPQHVRRHKLHVLISLMALLVPAVAVSALITQSEHYVYSVLSVSQVEMIEQMYDPNARVVGRTRSADSNVVMFGFYIYNNTSIGLRAIASGLLFGVGTILVLVMNGIILAAIVTHLLLHGYSSTLLPFVSGHVPFELTAIILAGAAGLRIAQALIAPGQFSRVAALRIAGQDALHLTYGVMLLFFAAAFIEAFWSAQPLPPILKYAVGLVLAGCTLYYFCLAGRRGS